MISLLEQDIESAKNSFHFLDCLTLVKLSIVSRSIARIVENVKNDKWLKINPTKKDSTEFFFEAISQKKIEHACFAMLRQDFNPKKTKALVIESSKWNITPLVMTLLFTCQMPIVKYLLKMNSPVNWVDSTATGMYYVNSPRGRIGYDCRALTPLHAVLLNDSENQEIASLSKEKDLMRVREKFRLTKRYRFCELLIQGGAKIICEQFNVIFISKDDLTANYLLSHVKKETRWRFYPTFIKIFNYYDAKKREILFGTQRIAKCTIL